MIISKLRFARSGNEPFSLKQSYPITKTNRKIKATSGIHLISIKNNTLSWQTRFSARILNWRMLFQSTRLLLDDDMTWTSRFYHGALPQQACWGTWKRPAWFTPSPLVRAPRAIENVQPQKKKKNSHWGCQVHYHLGCSNTCKHTHFHTHQSINHSSVVKVVCKVLLSMYQYWMPNVMANVANLLACKLWQTCFQPARVLTSQIHQRMR